MARGSTTPVPMNERADVFIMIAEVRSSAGHGWRGVSCLGLIYLTCAQLLTKKGRLAEASRIVSDAMHEFTGTNDEACLPLPGRAACANGVTLCPRHVPQVRVLVANAEIAIKRGDIDAAVHMLGSVAGARVVRPRSLQCAMHLGRFGVCGALGVRAREYFPRLRAEDSPSYAKAMMSKVESADACQCLLILICAVRRPTCTCAIAATRRPTCQCTRCGASVQGGGGGSAHGCALRRGLSPPTATSIRACYLARRICAFKCDSRGSVPFLGLTVSARARAADARQGYSVI